MRISLCLISLVAALAGSGCATSMGSASGDGRVVVAVDAPPQTSSEIVQVTEGVQPVAPEAAAPARRRLSETVTLGQGTTEPIYSPAQPQPQAGANGVVVNNNVTVVNGQAGYGDGAYYGGYAYGYGYGGYGGYEGYGRGSNAHSASRDGRGGGGPGNGAWAPSGWEGAQRTAAPGRTPGVGGNWAPARSFGPRSQR